VEQAEIVNARAPRSLARAGASDWLGHIRDELADYLAPDDQPW
jgi:hypothetical protein